MSIKLMDKVWELQSLTQPRKMLLLSIADYASDEGLAWPAVTTLMRKCSLRSESGTRRAINELVELGWLSKQERPRKERQGKHQQDTNLYQINLAKLYEEASIHEPVPRAPSKQKDNEPVHGDGSPCDGSPHEGSYGEKNGNYEPVPRTPDPSLNSKHDPSVKQISCPGTSSPDDEGASENNQAVDSESPPKGKWGSAEDHRCAEWIFSRIRKLYEKAAETDGELSLPKDPNWNAWANDIRLMRVIDHRSHRQICDMFRRVQGDRFWCRNILSPGKLREKWDELLLKLSPASPGEQGSGTMRATFDDEYYKGSSEAAANSGFRV